MILTVKPSPDLNGRIFLPASKSYSIRAFIIAACGGRSTIVHPSDCDDARVALSVARQLGAGIVPTKKDIWKITARRPKSPLQKIHVGESGTVLRFLLPLLPFYGQRATVVGKGTLQGRPNRHLTEALRAQGVDMRGQGPQESVPIDFSGGTLRGGNLKIDGTVSSQFISALLIATPRLQKDTTLRIQGKQLVSLDYIKMTLNLLQQSGIVIRRKTARLYKIPGRQIFHGLKAFVVPSDYGLAAFPLAAAALIRSKIILDGHFEKNLLQADQRILDFLKKMGVVYDQTGRRLKINGPFALRGGAFSLKDCPDLVPIMAVLALFASGPTRLYDIGHARVKESDRIQDLKNELVKTGAKVIAQRNALIIYPFARLPSGAGKSFVLLDPHRDHRLAMAFCILGLKIGVRVKDIECVSKSYPGFIKDLQQLGAQVYKKNIN